MPISFSCDQCGRSLRVRDDLAGEEIYCPQCRAILPVPYSDHVYEQADDERGSSYDFPGPSATEASDAEPIPQSRESEVVEEIDNSPTSQEPGRIRPLLVLAGGGLLTLAAGCVAVMVVKRRIIEGLVKFTVLLVFAGLATLARGLGNRRS